MTQIDAIYRGGIFQPLQPVKLADEQRVRRSIEPTGTAFPDAWLSHNRELKNSLLARHGVLPDSTPDIAADRLR